MISKQHKFTTTFKSTWGITLKQILASGSVNMLNNPLDFLSNLFNNIHFIFRIKFNCYPTTLRRVQITPKTSMNIMRYVYSRNIHKIHPHWNYNLAGWIINLLLDILLCNITEYFYSLFICWLALRAHQNMAQLAKIHSSTTQQNV